MSKENYAKTISFTKRMKEMIEEIEQHRGFPTFTSVVHHAVIELYKKEFPGYLVKREESPEERVERQEKEKDVKKKNVKKKLIKISDALGGKIINELGTEYCVYYTYNYAKRYEQKIPLNMLSTDLVASQYQPSKEAVEKLQVEGKTNY